MVDKQRIKTMLSSMSSDYKKNVEIIASEMRAMGIQKDQALFVLTDDKYDEKSCLLAILSLIETGKIDLNAKNDFEYNFVQNAIYEGYSTDFIVGIIEGIFTNPKRKNKFNINHVDEDGDTMLHSAIYADDFNGDIEVLYKVFVKYGFDSKIRDKSGCNIVKAMENERKRVNKFSRNQIIMIERMVNGRNDVKDIDSLLNNISLNYKKNVPVLVDGLKKLGYSKDDFLFALVEELHDELLVNIAVKSLLLTGEYSPNALDIYRSNFIQKAIHAGYSETFVLDMINTTSSYSRIKNKLDVNNVDVDKETILHSAIYAPRYKGDIALLAGVLKELGFDFKAKDEQGKTVLEAMLEQRDKKKYTDEDINKLTDVILNEEDKEPTTEDSEKSTDYSSIVEKMVNAMSGNLNKDMKTIDECIGLRKELTYNDLLYILSVKKLDEEKVVWAVKALLECGADANYVVFKGQNNIVQNFIEYGYSEKAIRNIIAIATKNTIKKPLNINYKNKNGDTILHTAVKTREYNGTIPYFYAFLLDRGFEVDVIDFLEGECEEDSGFDEEDLEAVKEIAKDNSRNKTHAYLTSIGSQEKETSSTVPVEVQLREDSRRRLTPSEIRDLEQYGTILNYKNFISEPVACREKEMKALMVALAQDKKSPIIVGESGVGKTVLVEELAYLIENDRVPDFLKNKIIFEISPRDLVAGCQYVGQFEKQLSAMFELAKKYDVILFIDEIHTMYGVGSTDRKSAGMEAYIKQFIDRNNVKLIGTTTEEEYQMFFANDALKRRFEKIKVEEPSEEDLRYILDKVIEDYCFENSLYFDDESDKRDIVDILVYATERSHRVYNDRVNNPDLSISIIDKAFAFAKYHNSTNITKEHFKEAFELCDRIYDSTRARAIERLNIVKNETHRKSKILTVDFTKFRR